ncbi:hypothetical protein BaRGS_00010918 [Batillaria attramentaria]|uniref:EF-hand domain-containing protein n=1 Tax=Batillaria attramentaria TaxID=370345 RepID=A0ABD0LFM6_9CAEN
MNVLFLLVAIVPACLCQTHGGTTYPDPSVVAHVMFLDADADNDTVLHKDELVAVFTKYDANNDGRVSRHEYSNYLQAHEPELVTLGHFLYDEYDADGDHHLEQHDFDIFYQKMDLDGT